MLEDHPAPIVTALSRWHDHRGGRRRGLLLQLLGGGRRVFDKEIIFQSSCLALPSLKPWHGYMLRAPFGMVRKICAAVRCMANACLLQQVKRRSACSRVSSRTYNDIKKVFLLNLKLKNKIELKKRQQQEDTQPRHFIKKK